MAEQPPVTDWAGDFDHLDPRWAADPAPIWAELRDTCPLAHTRRYGGVYLPTRYDDIRVIAYDPEHFSSRQTLVRSGRLHRPAPAPPMTEDPPRHREARMVLMSAFRPDDLAALETTLRSACAVLIARLPVGGADLVADYVRPLVTGALAAFIGLPEQDRARFGAWVEAVLDVHDQAGATAGLAALADYLAKQIARQRYKPGPGALGHLLQYRLEGQPLAESYVIASIRLLLLAGTDTSAGALGAAIWHLAQHETDRRLLSSGSADLQLALEELLRIYAPVTMAREVVADTEIAGTTLKAGQMVLLCFPAANRDPQAFPEPDRARLDRRPNRHMTFGAGIHRCIGAGVARLILRVGLEELLRARPEFRLDPAGAVTWSGGQVRGPLRLPVLFDAR